METQILLSYEEKEERLTKPSGSTPNNKVELSQSGYL